MLFLMDTMKQIDWFFTYTMQIHWGFLVVLSLGMACLQILQTVLLVL